MQTRRQRQPVTGWSAGHVPPVVVSSALPTQTASSTTHENGRSRHSGDTLDKELDVVVSHDPGTSSSMLQLESRLQKSSVYSMYQDDPSAGDRVEMRLLLLNENQRSELMRKLVTAFQEKVLLCFDHFNPELTLSCLRIVTSLSALKPHTKTLRSSCKSSLSVDGSKSPSCLDPFAELDMEDAMTRELPIFTTSRLRGTVQQILRRASLRQDGTLYFAESSKFATATKGVQYFVWFFDFMDYLQELHCNFTEKIFSPLFRYFYDDNFLSPNGRTNTMSSAFSKTSQFSDSEKQNGNDFDDTDSSAERAQILEQSKASLLQLSREFRDIKSIYDTTELTKIAERMSFVKEQLDYLFGEEDEVDPEIYSEESGKMVEHLDMDFGTENLIRLVPDILVKLRKAAWLAGRWLDLDDQRTKDVNEKLDKLVLIEEKLTDRLNSLNTDIANGEKKLERETDELSRLMEKEGRFDVLTFQTYDIDTHIKTLQKKVTQLNTERQQFVPKLAAIVKAKNLNEFQKLKFMFESNKLQRFITERKLATLHYQRNLLADDLNIDLYVRPSVIHCTNRLQDDCEHLEKQLREKRVEMVSIKRALMPVQEDKASLMHRISRERHRPPDWRTETSSARLRKLLLYPGNAVYIRSFPGAQYPVGFSRSARRDPRSTLIRRIPLRSSRPIDSPPAW